jgi:hypothetical protein
VVERSIEWEEFRSKRRDFIEVALREMIWQPEEDKKTMRTVDDAPEI